MAKFILVPYEPSHAERILKQGLRNVSEFINNDYNMRKISYSHAINGVGFTLIADDKIIGCAGVNIVKDRGLVWGLFSTAINGYKKTTLRITKITLDSIIKEHGLKNIYALVDEADEKAKSWIRVLNFMIESSTPKVMGPDNKYYLTYRRGE